MDIGSSQFPESFIEENELFDFLTSLNDNECTVTFPYLIRNFIEQIGYDFPSDDLFLVAIRKNTATTKNTFLSQINTDINETNNMLDRVHDFLLASPIESCQKLENDIEILLGEVLINCVQHGKDNANITSNGIIVQIQPYDDKVDITVLERGVFWDTNRSYSGAEIDKLLDELNELNDIIKEYQYTPQFNQELFDKVVEKIIVVDNGTLQFNLMGGIKLAEIISERRRCQTA